MISHNVNVDPNKFDVAIDFYECEAPHKYQEI
jgi:hypothetical protein